MQRGMADPNANLLQPKAERLLPGACLSSCQTPSPWAQEFSHGCSYRGSVGTSLTGIHEDAGLIPSLAQWVKDPVLL